jgi:inorganic pyrophosphatase
MVNFVGDIEPVGPDGDLRIVVDTPKGSRNKYKWDEELGLFRLTKVLPPGFAFPWNYGYLPGTLSGDGDPLDALVLMEEPVFCGCVILARPRAIVRIAQDGERNDRIVASPAGEHEDRIYEDEIPERIFSEIEVFFEGYHRLRGERVEALERGGEEDARRAIEEARRTYRERTRSSEE